MWIAILEAGYRIRKSRNRPLLVMRDGEAFLYIMESGKRKAKDIKIIVTGAWETVQDFVSRRTSSSV